VFWKLGEICFGIEIKERNRAEKGRREGGVPVQGNECKRAACVKIYGRGQGIGGREGWVSTHGQVRE